MTTPIRYVFWGSPAFAAIVLRGLIRAGVPPVAVVTNPDRPAGRKKILTPPATKAEAVAAGIRVIQPERLDTQAEGTLRALHAEFFVVAAYARIIPKTFISLPPRGILGIHPSLLPRYRGATPIQSALLAGEPRTGVTLFRMDEKVDHGPVIAQSTVPSQNRTYLELHDALAKAGAALLIKTLPAWIADTLIPRPQSESEATYCKKFTGADGFVDPASETPEAIERKIRALNPEPGVWTHGTFFRSRFPSLADTARVKLLKAALHAGTLLVTEIHIEGKKPAKLAPPFLLVPEANP